MACNCEKLKSLPTCLNELVIGLISLTSQDVYVFFKNISNGHVIRLTGVSDVDGFVTIAIPENHFTANYSYEIWITATTAGPDDKEDITFDSYVFYNCLSVEFYRIENDSLEAVYYTTVTAELE